MATTWPRSAEATPTHDYRVAGNAPAHVYEYGDVGEDATANTETFAGFGVPANDLAF